MNGLSALWARVPRPLLFAVAGLIQVALIAAMVIDRAAKTFGPALLSMGGSQNKKARGWNTRLTTLRVEVGGKLVQQRAELDPLRFGYRPLQSRHHARREQFGNRLFGNHPPDHKRNGRRNQRSEHTG